MFLHLNYWWPNNLVDVSALPVYYNYTGKFIPIFLLSIGLELALSLSRWAPRFRLSKSSYDFKDSVASMSTGVLQELCMVLFLRTWLLIAYFYVWTNWRVIALPETLWTHALCFVGVDFMYYWFHRAGHETFLWATHVTHHSSAKYNFTTALRQSALQYLSVPCFYALLGLAFPPAVFSVSSHFNRMYQFFVHTEAIDKLPWPVEYVFSTPSHHRVHHANDTEYLDRNYGGVFIIFDRLFGTFAEEKRQPTYGLTKQLRSYDPVEANVHYVRDDHPFRFGSLSQIVDTLRGPAHHAPPPPTSKAARAAAERRRLTAHFVPRWAPAAWAVYSLFQLFSALAVLRLIEKFRDWRWPLHLTAVAYVVSTLWSLGRRHDIHPRDRVAKKAWMRSEVTRISALIVFLGASIYWQWSLAVAIET